MIKLIFIFVICCLSLSDACSCWLPEGWQSKAYCESEFSGTIKVLTTAFNCGQMQHCYVITVVSQFRGAAITPFILQTASQSAACGVTLTQGNTYFVATNSINANIIGLNLCQLYENWTGLSKA